MYSVGPFFGLLSLCFFNGPEGSGGAISLGVVKTSKCYSGGPFSVLLLFPEELRGMSLSARHYVSLFPDFSLYTWEV